MNNQVPISQLDKTKLIKSLLSGISDDQASYQRLNQLLTQQREAMIACQAEQIDQINQQLMNHYQQLSESASRRSACLQALKLPSNARGINFLLSRLPGKIAQSTRDKWLALQSDVRNCQAMNERNGLLLSMQQEVMRPLLNSGSADFLYSR